MRQKEQFMQKTIVVWLGALICCTLWGSAYPCIKIGYGMFAVGAEDVASQILFAGCRFSLAGVLSILLGSAAGKKILIPGRTSWGKVLILCMMQTVLQQMLRSRQMVSNRRIQIPLMQMQRMQINSPMRLPRVPIREQIRHRHSRQRISSR